MKNIYFESSRNKLVYLDNAATTQVDPKVFSAMKPYFLSRYGNASEYHNLGRQARMAVEESRNIIASFLKADSSEIVFTGSATESVNLSHKGLIEALSLTGSHIITSQIEHKAVLETCRHLEESGMAEVTYLPVDKYGLVSIKEIRKAIRPKTVLISLMYANNEIGTIEPIQKVGRLVKELNDKGHGKIFFHTDATQAIQYLVCDVKGLGVDFLSFTGHKIYAPKGVGVLYVRSGSPLLRQMDGGSQESGFRAGTENVPYIVGVGKAVELVNQTPKAEVTRIRNLRDRLINLALKIPGVRLTGHPESRIPHIASFIIEGVEGEAVVLTLSNSGIYASSGSACTTSDLAPSHVLTAIGIQPSESHGSIRFSLGKKSTREEVDYLGDNFPKVIEKLRKMAPNL